MILTKWQDSYFDLVRDLGGWSGDWACDGLWELEKIHMNQGLFLSKSEFC